MNSTEIKLNKLIDLIRKDTGINNTMDAMEQLSAMLLLQYFYKGSLMDSFDIEKNQIDFSKFNDVLEVFFKNQKNEYVDYINYDKIKSILENIPFRIRSNKILEILLFDIENIEFNEQLAEAYDKLLVKMINESISSGAFYSSKVLASAIVKVINPSINQTIYDPALGTGRFIIEAQKNLLKSTLNDTQKLMRVYGRDISPFAHLVGSLNLLLNGINIENIFLEDSLLANDDLNYDIIFCASPFGRILDFDKNHYKYSTYQTMFLELTMKKLTQNGKAALIIPDGLLSDATRVSVNLRKELLIKFNLHSILSLPAGILAPYAGVKTSVLFFDNTEKENDIWFYELNTDKPLNRSNQVKDEDFTKFIESYSTRNESENSCLVNKQDILNTKELSLALELPKKINDINNFQMIDEIIFLEEKKKKFDILLSNFTDLLKENKKVEFSETMTLGELITIKTGKTLNKTEIKREGRYPVYGGNGIIGYYDQCNRNNENIIIGRVGAHCGNIHFVKGSIWLTINSFSVNINSSSKVYLPYLAHVLRSLNLNKLARGSAQPSISYTKIKDEKINLPFYNQQVELSEWFDKIEEQKQNLSKLLELQEEQFNKVSEYSIVSNCIKKNS